MPSLLVVGLELFLKFAQVDVQLLGPLSLHFLSDFDGLELLVSVGQLLIETKLSVLGLGGFSAQLYHLRGHLGDLLLEEDPLVVLLLELLSERPVLGFHLDVLVEVTGSEGIVLDLCAAPVPVLWSYLFPPVNVLSVVMEDVPLSGCFMLLFLQRLLDVCYFFNQLLE